LNRVLPKFRAGHAEPFGTGLIAASLRFDLSPPLVPQPQNDS